MSPLFDEVQKQAQLLTPQEKAALAHLLIEALDPTSDADVEQLWIVESQRRYEAYLRGELESRKVAKIVEDGYRIGIGYQRDKRQRYYHDVHPESLITE